MIVYYIKQEKDTIKEIVISGHANYKPKGEDIVCASVSMATFMTVNAIKFLKLEHVIETNLNDGYFKINQKSHNNTVNSLLKNLDYTIRDLIRQYPNHFQKN